jgi:short-subunit dehydrogenase
MKNARASSFEGKHALVTGAASGIGRATAIELARRGAHLTLVDIDDDRLEETRRLVVASTSTNGSTTNGSTSKPKEHAAPRRLFTLRVDIADAAAVDALASDVAPVDILVNNAGVAVVAPFAETSAEDWRWMSGVNLFGPLRLTRALLPSMIARGSGHVVLVASLGGLVAAPGMTLYSTTKFAMVGFGEALRLELAGSGVDVTVVCPGYVRTGLHAATRYGNEGFRRFLDRPPSWYGMEKEEVATALADAVSDRRPLVVLGPERVGWWLKRLAPEAAFAVSRWVARRTIGVG